MPIKCVSCGKSVETDSYWVRFPCPACGEESVVRCERCRKIVVTYKCPKCGFDGP
jgi:predicted RNA-binding Zn-ribbon protein involved in translation (DUF1610 family)